MVLYQLLYLSKAWFSTLIDAVYNFAIIVKANYKAKLLHNHAYQLTISIDFYRYSYSNKLLPLFIPYHLYFNL